MNYLVESALLTHGLKSVANDKLQQSWNDVSGRIAWVDGGEIRVGGMQEYLPFRERAAQVIRIDSEHLEESLERGLSGALTASGTMKVCERYGIPLAITCGMGGIGDIVNEELCPDLPALAEIPVLLLTAGPKDMLDRDATYDWLRRHGVRLMGVGSEISSGYLFCGKKLTLDGVLLSSENIFEDVLQPPLLLVQEIPEKQRIADSTILEQAILCGKQAERRGEYYYPAVNGFIDDATGGYSSIMQLAALIRNIEFAEQL